MLQHKKHHRTSRPKRIRQENEQRFVADLYFTCSLQVADGGNNRVLDLGLIAMGCAYGEILSVHGEKEKAEAAFDHAVSLGPGMPPVLMRAANYDFTHGRREQGLRLASGILSRTNTFDEIVFSYLLAAGVPARTLLGTAIPAEVRPAQAWLSWLRFHGADQDVADTWTWMKGNRMLDEKSAGEVAWALWNRGSYGMAYALWGDWVGRPNVRQTPTSWQTPISGQRRARLHSTGRSVPAQLPPSRVRMGWRFVLAALKTWRSRRFVNSPSCLRADIVSARKSDRKT